MKKLLCYFIVMNFIMIVAVAKNIKRYPRNRLEHSSGNPRYFEIRNSDGIFQTQVSLDRSFNANQNELIYNATRLFIERSIEDYILDCAYENSSKDLPLNREYVVSQLKDALQVLTVNNIQIPAFIFIAKYWDDPMSVGIAYVNIFYDNDFPLPGYSGRHYLHIALNSDFLGDHSSYIYSRDENYWAGVIGHEFLHNLGYRHPTGYSGSFIKEYGKCIAGNGISMDSPFEVNDFDVIRDM